MDTDVLPKYVYTCVCVCVCVRIALKNRKMLRRKIASVVKSLPELRGNDLRAEEIFRTSCSLSIEEIFW